MSNLDWSIIDECPKDEADYQRLLRSKIWRLNNLYWIKDKAGKKIRFRMNAAQRLFYEFRHVLDIILKARQLGFTTFIQIDMLDDCLFIENFSAGVIAHNREDAEAFFSDKIKFAYENLPAHIRNTITAVNDRANTLKFSNGSRIRVGTSFRSGTMQYLHVSELGKLAANDPNRAKEVKTGAFPAVDAGGRITVESTAEGRTGLFFDLCDESQKSALLGEMLTDLDFKFHFFPWFDDPRYTIDHEGVAISSRIRDYTRDISTKLNIEFTEGQIAWYMKKDKQQGDEMKREYPSTPEEAFEQSIEGAYFKKQMATLRIKRSICKIPIEPGIPIQTFWDLGKDTTSIWFFQQVGYEHRFIDYFHNSGEDIWYYIDILKKRMDGNIPYLYGDCYIPHDGKNKPINAKESVAEALYNNGFQVRLVKRIADKSDSILHARQALPKVVIDMERCEEGIAGLDNYRKEWDKTLLTWKKQPRHDAASHPADAFMVYADGYYHEEEIDDHLESFDQIHYTASPTTGY